MGGVLLFVILIVTLLLRAKNLPEFAAAGARLQTECCACTTTFSARRATLIVCGALAVVTLALAGTSDSKPCDPSDASPKLGLAAAAFGIQFFGGAVMYCFSSCGCRLCCVCRSGVCNRTMQATSAIGCSLLMWWLSLFFFIWIVLFLSLELSEQRSGYYSSMRSNGLYPDICYWTHTFVPSGLTSIAGILSAASLVLHGHFVTLVPEAVYNLDPPPPPAQPDAGAQPQNAADMQPPNAVNTQFEPGTGRVLPDPELVLLAVTVAPPFDEPRAVPAAASV